MAGVGCGLAIAAARSSLRTRSENASSRIRLRTAHPSHLDRTKFVRDFSMADGAGKIAAQKEVAQAQEALLGGKIGACAMHLSRAMHAGTMNQAPAETTTQTP